MTDLSEYETASEFMEDPESGNEPPKDMLFLKKMVHKGEKLRIYKKIAKIGKSYMDMPAKCDQVVLRIREFNDNSLEINLEKEIQKETFSVKQLSDFEYLKAMADDEGESFKTERLEKSYEEKLLLAETGIENQTDLRVLQMGRDFRTNDLVITVSNMKKGLLSPISTILMLSNNS